MLHALCVVLTVGVVWMSYAFSAIEDTVERRDEVYRILVGVFTTFTFIGCGAALMWLCEEDRKGMAWALAMMLAMIILMHIMIGFAQLLVGKTTSNLMMGTLFGSFTLVVYCIMSLIIFSNSDLAVFGVARNLKRSVTGHLPIDEWLYVKKPAVLRVLSHALGEHNHAYQFAAKRLDELGGKPEVKDVLLIAKDAVSMLEDRVRVVADIVEILADAVVRHVAVLPAQVARKLPVLPAEVDNHVKDDAASEPAASTAVEDDDDKSEWEAVSHISDETGGEGVNTNPRPSSGAEKHDDDARSDKSLRPVRKHAASVVSEGDDGASKRSLSRAASSTKDRAPSELATDDIYEDGGSVGSTSSIRTGHT